MKKLILFLVFCLFCFYFLQPISLVTSDLGRHLKNGELFLVDRIIPKTNLYSYTTPDFPFINHHWGSGVLFYIVYSTFGFTGLSFFLLFISLSIFFIFFRLAWKYSNFYLAVFASIIVFALFGTRTEVRPELFSYLLGGIFLWILVKVYHGHFKPQWLFILPILEVLWVNLHVYFLIGYVLVGAFLLDSFIKSRVKHLRKILMIVFFLTIMATLINPFGLSGAVYPFSIFDNYEFAVVENDSVISIMEHIIYMPAVHFLVAFFVLLGSLITGIVRKRELNVWLFLLVIIFSYFGFSAVRNFALFAYFAIPLIAISFRWILPSNKKIGEIPILKFINKTPIVGVPVIACILILFLYSPFMQAKQQFGIGLDNKSEQAAKFFKENNLKGPIFNNYDIGGYLIYHLYPQEKVFVDNRPEAYPPLFLSKTYVQAQLGAKWAQVTKQYGINSIFFHRRDASAWGRNFLTQRMLDKNWALVFADEYAVIFLKRVPQNESLIQQFEREKIL